MVRRSFRLLVVASIASALQACDRTPSVSTHEASAAAVFGPKQFALTAEGPLQDFAESCEVAGQRQCKAGLTCLTVRTKAEGLRSICSRECASEACPSSNFQCVVLPGSGTSVCVPQDPPEGLVPAVDGPNPWRSSNPVFPGDGGAL